MKVGKKQEEKPMNPDTKVKNHEQMANEFNNELQLEIFKTLMSIMRDDKASARDRMQAATMLNTMSVNITRIKNAT
jgi:hypothetical protein